MRRVWVLVIVVLAAATGICPVLAMEKALPRIPKMVSELYLPEEQQASRALYNLYDSLSPVQLATLEKGGKVTVEAAKLSPQFRATLSAWFNSARWGCEPPAEQVTAESVRQAAAVFASKDQVVDFSLQSPQRHIWKKLTIACAPERAEWVRNGLPLWPSWVSAVWDGGTRPPNPPLGPGWSAMWEALRPLYGVYADLPASSLRQIHRDHTLRVGFQGLPRRGQDALTHALDLSIRDMNIASHLPLETGRRPAARKRNFGLTEIVFSYGRAHPDCQYGNPQGGEELNAFPRPYRAIYLRVHASLFPPCTSTPKAMIAKYGTVYRKPGYLVAMQPELQRRILAWRRDVLAWESKWEEKRGGDRVTKPGAPPFPELWK